MTIYKWIKRKEFYSYLTKIGLFFKDGHLAFIKIRIEIKISLQFICIKKISNKKKQKACGSAQIKQGK